MTFIREIGVHRRPELPEGIVPMMTILILLVV